MSAWRRRWSRTVVSLRRVLVKPLLQEGRSPEYAARTVGIGLFVAFTPTVGLQIVLGFALWATARGCGGAPAFNPVVASAWTMITNVFTVAPIYYVFVQTGRVMLGRWEQLRSYEFYLVRFGRAEDSATGLLDGFGNLTFAMLTEFGAPLCLGAVPWAISISALGYWWSLSLVRQRRLRSTKPTALG